MKATTVVDIIITPWRANNIQLLNNGTLLVGILDERYIPRNDIRRHLIATVGRSKEHPKWKEAEQYERKEKKTAQSTMFARNNIPWNC